MQDYEEQILVMVVNPATLLEAGISLEELNAEKKQATEFHYLYSKYSNEALSTILSNTRSNILANLFCNYFLLSSLLL